MPLTTPIRVVRAHPEPRAETLPKYMARRGRTLYFKRKIPSDVADAFPQHAGQVWKSLGTDLVSQARVLLAVEVTEFEMTVAQLRREKARQAVGGALPLLRDIGAPVPALPAVAKHLGLVSGHVHSRPASALHEPLSARPIRDPSRPDSAKGPKRAREQPPGELTGTRTRGSGGDRPVQTNTRGVAATCNVATFAPAGASRDRRPQLLHLFEDWRRTQTRPRTISAVQSVVMDFRVQFGPVAVEDITRAHVRAFRDALVERKLSKLTVENRLGYLSTLIRHGMREIVDHLALNPFENVPVVAAEGSRPPKDRRAYSVAELNQVLSSRVYVEGYRPRGQVREAAYWLPLMGPFVGARIEELCQLRVDDIQRINGVWCIRLCDLGESQRLKTASSFRRVPLHQTLIDCGFLRHVASMALQGHERVFPSLSNRNAHGVFSNAMGKWFARYLDDVGLSDSRLDYHSFRYTFRQQCSLCGIDNEVRDALTGHWLTRSDAGRTYMRGENRQYPFPKLVEAIELLRYDELRTTHLLVENPLAGVEEALMR